ncbi:ATP-binding protein [uncultured Sphingomonas sp.]|uniref:ATP-binding protein n=1 Tax=uncultured Sphingomonas sp. TaxID=158754 RepID=UPI0035CA12DC
MSILSLFQALPLALLLAGAAVPAAAADDQRFRAIEGRVAQIRQALMRDPSDALLSAMDMRAAAGRLPDSARKEVAVATALMLEGEAQLFLNHADEAVSPIDRALATVMRTAPNTKLHGDVLRSRGSIAAMTGRPLDALRDYQSAHDVFRRVGDARARALTLQDIGLIYFDANDYERVLDYSRQAEAAYPKDAMLSLTLRNNRAEVYRKQRRHAMAAEEYRGALVHARKLGARLLQARINANLAESEAEAGRLGRAQAAVDEAMRLTARGEAAEWRRSVYGSAAMVAIARQDFDRAATLMDQTFAGVDLESSDALFRDHHHAAALVYEKRGDIALALRHLKAFERLDKEAQTLTATTASQLMAARFDFANQDLQISKLKQEQLARDIAVERDKSRAGNILFGSLAAAGAVILCVLLFGFFAVRRSRDAVAAANTSLTDVNGALEKALTAKTEFLATTSHEIRTPLNGILGMTQVLLADRGIDAAVRERIEVVHGAGETMKALVDDILDVAKMESGELTVASEPTDLAAILDDAARLWGGHAQAKGLELVLDMNALPRRIVSDGGRLRQIVFNLMSNALKFTSVGRVTLFAGVETSEDGTEMLAIRVIDTGIGIPLDQQAAVFEAFKQVDGGTTRQFGGTGLGLAICKKLAIALGGDIAVSSILGQGTTFEALLPLIRAEVEKASTAEPEHDRTLGQARMLILDRNPLNQGVMRVLLGAEAGHVAVADTVADALAALAALAGSDAPTHIVIDVGSIAGEGIDLISTLRDLTGAARAADAHCSLLLAPAAAGLTIAEAMAVGGEQLIVKPIGAADLMAAFKSLYGDDPDSLVAPDLLGARAA